MLKNGKPYRGIGINYFDCFLRTLNKADGTSYDFGFATLAAKGIPFARFCATGFSARRDDSARPGCGNRAKGE